MKRLLCLMGIHEWTFIHGELVDFGRFKILGYQCGVPGCAAEKMSKL